MTDQHMIAFSPERHLVEVMQDVFFGPGFAHHSFRTRDGDPSVAAGTIRNEWNNFLFETGWSHCIAARSEGPNIWIEMQPEYDAALTAAGLTKFKREQAAMRTDWQAQAMEIAERVRKQTAPF
ncbi:MAG: hypothetical protein ACKOX6_00815 [Bdellovibrio sp.]